LFSISFLSALRSIQKTQTNKNLSSLSETLWKERTERLGNVTVRRGERREESNALPFLSVRKKRRWHEDHHQEHQGSVKSVSGSWRCATRIGVRQSNEDRKNAKQQHQPQLLPQPQPQPLLLQLVHQRLQRKEGVPSVRDSMLSASNSLVLKRWLHKRRGLMRMKSCGRQKDGHQRSTKGREGTNLIPLLEQKTFLRLLETLVLASSCSFGRRSSRRTSFQNPLPKSQGSLKILILIMLMENLKQFLGVVLAMGLAPNTSVRNSWKTNSNIHGKNWTVRMTLSCDVFEVLMRTLSVDWHEMAKVLASKFEKHSIDESMVGTKVRCKIRVYIPHKPHPNGIKLWSISDEAAYFFSF
jgi:hypothetical protein